MHLHSPRVLRCLDILALRKAVPTLVHLAYNREPHDTTPATALPHFAPHHVTERHDLRVSII